MSWENANDPPSKDEESSTPGIADVADYDLNSRVVPVGLRAGLTSYGDQHFSLFLRKAFIKALGYSSDALSRSIVGVTNTYSGFNPCHGNVPQLMEAVKRGVLLEGGLGVDFPTITLHESFASPTSMLYRNLMSMDTEEAVNGLPADAWVGIGGCDKTLPAQVMAAVSANRPFVSLCTGPMLTGTHPSTGNRVGACTDCRSNWAAYRAGSLDIEEIAALNDELAPSIGTCGVMGTASTMALLIAVMGLMPLHAATPAAVSSARIRVAEETGRIAARVAKDKGPSPQRLLTFSSFHNAIVVLQAIGGSTNAIVHLLAIANRLPSLNPRVTLSTISSIGKDVPLLVDLKPSGMSYMTDLHSMGGLPLLLQRLKPLLHLSAQTITGQALGEAIDSHRTPTFNAVQSVIRSVEDPLYPSSSLAVLNGNLCPRGAVMKASASLDRRLLHHRGPACVFENSEELTKRIDDPRLEVSADSVLVLKRIGPVGYPGMPEAGLIPIPRKLARQGVKDMLRISDGRMSGTAGGSIVLHVAPEAALSDSTFGIVLSGDVIEIDVVKGKLELCVEKKEITRRMQERRASGDNEVKEKQRGYRGLHIRCVNQVDEGCDLDFLVPAYQREDEKDGVGASSTSQNL